MKKIRKNSLFKACFWVAGLLAQACNEPSKGCLDLKATNFDVTAETDCDACCTYPNLRLQVGHYWEGDTLLALGGKYRIGTDSIQILDIQLYLSDFQVTNTDNGVSRVKDSVFLIRYADTLKVENSFALLGRKNGFDYKIGTFSGAGRVAQVSFTVGLGTVANGTNPNRMTLSHPLSIKADSMYLGAERQYIYQKIIFARAKDGVNFKDTVQVNITTAANVTVTAANNLVFKEGFDAVLPLRLYYRRLFEGVNFSSDKTTMANRIVSNTTSNLFSIQ